MTNCKISQDFAAIFLSPCDKSSLRRIWQKNTLGTVPNKGDIYTFFSKDIFRALGIFLKYNIDILYKDVYLINSLTLVSRFWIWSHKVSHPGDLLVRKTFYHARAERGLLTNYKDTIPGPIDSTWAKMYILEKCILRT